MVKKFRKSYKFAFYTALLIAITSTLLMSVFLYAFYVVDIFLIALWFVCCFVLTIFVTQYRAEEFIFKGINKIYDNMNLLENRSFLRTQVTTDMKTLASEIDKYAKDKKLEIESLKIREHYRKEFIGNVSHELKTPLFTVQSYIATLLDGASEDPELCKKYLKRADNGVERLTYILNDLDMITKLETGDLVLHIDAFDIIALVENVFDLMEFKAKKKKISLMLDANYHEPILVFADKERITQVLTNLIVNSIKYGQKNGTTEISVEPFLEDRVLIRVTDNGEGIQEEHFPRIFERFYRVDKSGSRKEGGSGLGLAIVKHILEAHNEKIYIESKHGIGSEFSFTLQTQPED